ncbi:MAG: hypothetical protein ACXV3B_06755 [Ilumatobacteraceae bacterium]
MAAQDVVKVPRIGGQVVPATPRRKRSHSGLRWPIVVVALLLESVVGASTQGSAAHAAPPGESYRFSISAVDQPRTTLCLGETTRYTVKVFATPTLGTSPVIEVPGVKVEASVVGVGAFIGTTGSGVNGAETGFDIDHPVGIQFSFKAGQKPGTTRLTFAATVKGDGIDNGQVSSSLPVRVIECRFYVAEYTHFGPNALDNPSIPYPPIIASLSPTLLTADVNGHFTASATMNWIGSTLAGGGVSVTEKFASGSRVDITGEMSDDGTLSLKFVYQMVMSSVVEKVGPVTQGGPGGPYLLDPLQVAVNPHGSPVARKPQGYGRPDFPGRAVVVVITEKE